MTHYMQEYHNNKKKTKPQNSAALVYSYENRSKELQRSMMRASLFFELLFRRKPRRRSGFRCKRNENTKTFPFIERFFSCIRTRCKQKPLRPTSSNRTCRSDVYRPLAPRSTRDKASNNAPDPNLKQLAPGSKPFGPLVSSRDGATAPLTLSLKQLAPGYQPFGPLVSTGDRAPSKKDKPGSVEFAEGS